MKINISFDLKGNTILDINNEIIERKTFLVKTELLTESSVSYYFKKNWRWVFIWSADTVGYEFIEIREYFKPEKDEMPPKYIDGIKDYRILAKWSYDIHSNELYKLIFNKEYFPNVSEIKIAIKNTGKTGWVLNCSN